MPDVIRHMAEVRFAAYEPIPRLLLPESPASSNVFPYRRGRVAFPRMENCWYCMRHQWRKQNMDMIRHDNKGMKNISLSVKISECAFDYFAARGVS
jgi:hypothetical protein